VKDYLIYPLHLLSISIVLVGCQKSWPEPPNLSGIDTVCLNIEMSRTETNGHWIYNDEDIERLLNRMDIDFVPEGQACDATLTLTGTGIPYGDEYTQEHSSYTTYCYTGGKVNGKLTFSLPGQDPLVFPFRGTRPKQESISGCSKTAPFYEIIYKPMLQAFIHLFGPEFAIRNLVEEKNYIKDFLIIELDNMGADAIPAWIDCLSYDKDGLAGICARTLGKWVQSQVSFLSLIKNLKAMTC
jgi:hypothetical protein